MFKNLPIPTAPLLSNPSGRRSAPGGESTTIAGGVPVKTGGKLVGGIGVGGSADVTQDAVCAMAALKAIE